MAQAKIDFAGRLGKPGEALMAGETWEAFADALRDAGRAVLADHAPASPTDRAEGFRYLTRLTNAALTMFVEFSDPNHPEIGRFMDTSVKWGLDNVDALYGKCSIRADQTYRIRGSGGSAHFLGFYAQAGKFGDDTPEGKAAPGGVAAVVSNLELEFEPDGSFELIASREQHDGNWLPLTDATTGLGVRQFFNDWENETAWDLSIESLDHPEPPPPLTPEALDRKLRHAIRFINPGCWLWDRLSREWWEQPPNQVTMIEKGRSLTDPDQDYGFGRFQLDDDEALVVEFVPPDCHYWSVQLYNWWGESFDYVYRQSSLNGHQARLDPDGVFRGVISLRDPGVPNWIDTAGHSEGVITPRFLRAQSPPEQHYRVVKHADLRSVLPSDTPNVSEQDRAESLDRRRHGVWRRFRD